MQFRLLGPVEVRVDDHVIDVGPALQRSVLAVLLLDANRSISADQLVERAWGNRRLPRYPRNAVQTYVSLLRRALGSVEDVVILRQSNGYLLNLDERLADVHEFHALVGQARSAQDSTRAMTLLERALKLWQGEPFGALDTPWLSGVRAALNQERQAAERDLTDLQLEHGMHGSLIAQLSEWSEQCPLDERLAGQLMLALFRSGRQADALQHYRDVRERLAEELGADPSQALQELHYRILSGGPTLASPRIDPEPAPKWSGVPRQLPAEPRLFTGRACELAAISAAMDADGKPDRALTVVTISGGGGVGKSWLALQWAHQNLNRFPDGQLYVNLRGFDPSGEPMSPAAAIRGFLDALGVDLGAVPADLHAQTGLFRSLLADRRMLIVLDNARNAEQVSALLPGSPTCLVIVTSRSRLTSLVTTESAHPIALDLLDVDEARSLLIHRIGPPRADDEPHAVDDLIELCAKLPLALSIVAARAAVCPDHPLSAMVKELRETRRLDALYGGDTATDLRAVFSWSYKALSDPARRMFRLLGVHPGPYVSRQAAMSLTGMSQSDSRRALDELTHAHLVTESAPGRFILHDLLHAYAAELAHSSESDVEQRAAVHRLLDHYLHTARRADSLLRVPGDPIVVDPPLTEVPLEHLDDHKQALEWFEAEHQVLLKMVGLAAGQGFDVHAWQIPSTIADFLRKRGYWRDLDATQRIALAAAVRLEDLGVQARAYSTRGLALMRSGRLDEAEPYLRHALALHRRLGDVVGRAYVHTHLGWLYGQKGRHVRALRHAIRSLRLFEARGHRPGQARALNAIGWYHALLQNYDQTLVYCARAEALCRELGDRYVQAGAWDSLGYAHHHLGHGAEALVCYQRALALYRDIGDRYYEAETLTHLGDYHLTTGDSDAAAAAWRQALSIFDKLAHSDAEAVRSRLRLRDAF